MSPLPIIHLIANAHLDPVWLWDRREGMAAGVATCRAVLDLMDEFPELTFTRGESAIYEWIEHEEPALFERIVDQVAAGRWEIVGGSYIQPDMNLPGTETLLGHFERDLAYFQKRFGKVPTVAWAADAFGHSAGLPEILAAAGMDGFVFCRPQACNLEIPEAAFQWEAASGAQILAYRALNGSYLTERHDVRKALDQTLELGLQSSLQNHACFYGLGNHGGGPSRRHLHEIRAWATEHPEVQVIHSGLHRLLEAIREEERLKKQRLPIVRGELNFVFRGCYASVAKLKFAYRKAEAEADRASRAIVIAATADSEIPASSQSEWDAAHETILFNSFHDILPGSSIERATEEQIDEIRGALARLRQAEAGALSALARRIDTSVRMPAGCGTDHPLPTPSSSGTRIPGR